MKDKKKPPLFLRMLRVSFFWPLRSVIDINLEAGESINSHGKYIYEEHRYQGVAMDLNMCRFFGSNKTSGKLKW